MLRAFEAAARHSNMSHAAAELNVTPGAISRQIVALEELFDIKLFRRRSKGIELTIDGARLYHGLYNGFERIRTTIADIRRDARQVTVRITTLPSLASRWLVPKLVRFQELYGSIAVNIDTNLQLEDISKSNADLAIRFGGGKWPDLHAELLMPTSYYPVCSPKFLRDRGITQASDLLNVPLIHDETKQWWIDWFVAAGINLDVINSGIIIDDYNLAIQFALDGYGVMLGRDPLLNRELETGSLVRMFEIEAPSRFSYYFAWNAARVPKQETMTLVNWLRSEATADRQAERLSQP
ncbi:MAG: LysR substrate-binding domain-containing protein [Caulobacteraceae bacterium]